MTISDDPSTGIEPPSRHSLTAEMRDAIVRTMLDYAVSQPPVEWVFIPDLEADALLRGDPFAFLVAVICAQGVKAERAWRVPYELKRRIGCIDPKVIAADPTRMLAALKGDPAECIKPLVRYVNKTPKWVAEAASLVMTKYGGDAGRIWEGKLTAREVMGRLDEFSGIEQKKSAMAVELLERCLHVEITDLGCSDVAYDVHVRRVFLRSGLAERDTIEDVVAAARRAYPRRPGALDGPAWAIGRTYCRRSVPDCDVCPLGSVCMRLVGRARSVMGG